MDRPRLALYTFGIFRQPAEHADNSGFHERNDPILALAERSSGFIARAGYDDEPSAKLWGPQVFPRFYVERGDGWSPSTLSLWQDAESAMAFSYSGLHAEALKLGRQWMVEPGWPPYVAWWVDAGHVPDWAEAVSRHEHLHDYGSSPYAFDFKKPFGPEGLPGDIDRALVRLKAAANATHAVLTED